MPTARRSNNPTLYEVQWGGSVRLFSVLKVRYYYHTINIVVCHWHAFILSDSHTTRRVLLSFSLFEVVEKSVIYQPGVFFLLPRRDGGVRWGIFGEGYGIASGGVAASCHVVLWSLVLAGGRLIGEDWQSSVMA